MTERKRFVRPFIQTVWISRLPVPTLSISPQADKTQLHKHTCCFRPEGFPAQSENRAYFLPIRTSVRLLWFCELSSTTGCIVTASKSWGESLDWGLRDRSVWKPVHRNHFDMAAGLQKPSVLHVAELSRAKGRLALCGLVQSQNSLSSNFFLEVWNYCPHDAANGPECSPVSPFDKKHCPEKSHLSPRFEAKCEGAQAKEFGRLTMQARADEEMRTGESGVHGKGGK